MSLIPEKDYAEACIVAFVDAPPCSRLHYDLQSVKVEHRFFSPVYIRGLVSFLGTRHCLSRTAQKLLVNIIIWETPTVLLLLLSVLSTAMNRKRQAASSASLHGTAAKRLKMMPKLVDDPPSLASDHLHLLYNGLSRHWRCRCGGDCGSDCSSLMIALPRESDSCASSSTFRLLLLARVKASNGYQNVYQETKITVRLVISLQY